MTEFDYIVVGAGSAGCVLAWELSQDPSVTVLVVEAGGSDRSLWIRTPVGYGKSYFDPRVNWMFETDPDPGTGGRRGYWPRGKVLGGSSSINALIYFRGLPQDFDDWEAAGAQGWNREEVHRQYEAMERRIDAEGHRQGSGRVVVSDPRHDLHPSTRHYFAMARELGLPLTDDCNSAECEGITHYRLTTRRGRRWSAANAFLHPALRRKNVTLASKTLVERILLKDRRATGIIARHRGGRVTFQARRELILAAGAVNSPKLLQLSGIGPGAHLAAMGIEVVIDNPHVGGNLQDHLGVNYNYRATEPTLNSQLAPLWGKLWHGMRYVLTRHGPVSLSVNQCGGFLRSRPDLEWPDVQIYLNPITYRLEPGRRQMIIPDPWPGFILSFQPCRPRSRGRIDITSPDPDAAPGIVPNYLSDTADLDDVIAGGRLIQQMAQTKAIRAFAQEAQTPDISQLDDEGILEDFRTRCGTVFHPVGTCRMGREGEAVTGPDLRVFGIEGLRVIDASSFPNITSGNTNAPVMMLAQRAAGLIRAARP